MDDAKLTKEDEAEDAKFEQKAGGGGGGGGGKGGKKGKKDKDNWDYYL